MRIKHLIEMANDIGNFFESEPKHEDAVEGVYEHLSKFWEKRMRTQIITYIDEKGDEELLPIVREAVQQMKADEERKATA